MKKDVKSNRPFLRTFLNYHLGDSIKDMEIPRGVSETFPDQAMSAAEMLRRHMSGLSISGKVPMYSDYEIPDLQKMDLVEVSEYREHLQSEIDKAQKAHKDASNALAKKQQDELIERELQKRMKDAEKNTTPKKDQSTGMDV